MRDLPALLDRLEAAGGPADPVPSADGWELVLAEAWPTWSMTSAAGKHWPTCGGWPGWTPSRLA